MSSSARHPLPAPPQQTTEVKIESQILVGLVNELASKHGVKVVCLPKNWLAETAKTLIGDKSKFREVNLPKTKEALLNTRKDNLPSINIVNARKRKFQQKLASGLPIYMHDAAEIRTCKSGSGAIFMRKAPADLVFFLDHDVSKSEFDRAFGTNVDYLTPSLAFLHEKFGPRKSIDTQVENLPSLSGLERIALVKEIMGIKARIAQKAARQISRHRKFDPSFLLSRVTSSDYRSTRAQEFIATVLDGENPSITAKVIAIEVFEETWAKISETVDQPKTALPLLPTQPLAVFKGGRGNDPIAFLEKNYGVWISARVFDWKSLGQIDPVLARKVSEQCARNTRRGLDGPKSLLDIFPSVVEAREARDLAYTGSLSAESIARKHYRDKQKPNGR